MYKDKYKIVGIIPARLESTRLPKKPLIDISGMSMISHVYHRALLSNVLDDVIVATDAVEIINEIEKQNGKAILTSVNHKKGTERISEAVENIDADIVVLIFGDEPLLNPDYIKESVDALINRFSDDDVVASILCNKFTKENSTSDMKIALNLKSEVMYFSRGDIPCNARNFRKNMTKAYHIMAFKKDFLKKYKNWDKTPNELIEDNEHLRILEHGYKIQATLVESSAVSVDTADDLEYVRKEMLIDPIFPSYAHK